MNITDPDVKNLKLGDKPLSQSFGRGCGSFVARPLSNGVEFYFRYTYPQKNQKRFPIGRYDSKGLSGLTLKQAREKAKSLSFLYSGGEGNSPVKDIHGHFQKIEKERLEQEDAEKKRREQELKERNSGRLCDLLKLYVEELSKANETTARDAGNIFHNHIEKEFPQLWEKKANKISKIELRGVLSTAHDKGLVRTPDILRTYLSAAYNKALAAEDNATLGKFLLFNVEHNPIASIKPLGQPNKPRDEEGLSDVELRKYWDEISRSDEPVNLALRLSLLLGGQRVAQFVRMQHSDIFKHSTGIIIRLFDSKGRGITVRKHYIPLTNTAEIVLKKLLEINCLGDHVISTDGGITHINHSTLNNKVKGIARISVGLLRKTVETWLSSRQINKDTRGRLQSHGISGVQDKHYDMWDYHPEKLHSLELLETWLLNPEKAENIVDFSRRGLGS